MNSIAMRVSSPASTPVTNTGNQVYSSILRIYNVKYRETEDGYLQVREPEQKQGWILNVSAIKTEIGELLKDIIPVLIKEKAAFKVIKDKATANLLLDGRLGYTNTGKILTIYPASNESVRRIARSLMTLTIPYRGPEIPTDLHLGGTVYTQYCTSYAKTSPNGETQTLDNISFQYPKGIAWPFDIPVPSSPKREIIIGDTCLITSTIKSDAKGAVCKGVMLTGWWLKRCLIKEGKYEMYSDDAGRSIQARLKWQYDLQKELTDLPLPKAYDLINQGKHLYLIMEFIKGHSLLTTIGDVYEYRCWSAVSLDGKLLLLDYLLRVIGMIEKLHQKGIVHRDITPVNFLMDKHGKLFMIDLELAYSIPGKTPDPPFGLGTNGFMSIEQECSSQPTVKEDIYGLGALMIVFFTNLYPSKFGKTRLREKLSFFIQDEVIKRLITDCLQADPYARPELEEIKEILTNYKNELHKAGGQDSRKEIAIDEVDRDKLIATINESIHALSTPLMAEENNVWHSNAEDEKLIANKQRSHSYFPGINGVAGVMYLLAEAKRAGVSIMKTMPVCTRSIKYMRNAFHPVKERGIPGLYEGTHGIAVFHAAALESGLLTVSQDNKTFLRDCLQINFTGLDVASGAAGQGLAVLSCLDYLEEADADSKLLECVNAILSQQLSDGSWKYEQTNEKRTGFSYGVAGIVIFLIEYYKYTPSDEVKQAIFKGLHWLQKQSRKKKDTNTLIWSPGVKNRKITAWLGEGFTGVALSFIRAYEVFQEPSFKETAEAALYNNPFRLICRNFGMLEGISGIGEVYLEASIVFQNKEWQQRADWIANMLINTRVHQQDGSSYWTVVENRMPTADLLTGNGGIIRFLLRHSMREELNFPFL